MMIGQFQILVNNAEYVFCKIRSSWGAPGAAGFGVITYVAERLVLIQLLSLW